MRVVSNSWEVAVVHGQPGLFGQSPGPACLAGDDVADVVGGFDGLVGALGVDGPATDGELIGECS